MTNASSTVQHVYELLSCGHIGYWSLLVTKEYVWQITRDKFGDP